MHMLTHLHLRPDGPRALLRSTCVGLLLVTQQLCLCNARGQAVAAENPYAHDSAALRKGGNTYRVNCDFCHGIDARGENGAPDLTSPRTQRHSDAELFRIILDGRPGTEMSANDLSEKETLQVIAYLRSVRSSSNAVAGGDREAGRRIFFDKIQCSGCHMIDGKGGRLGPDLSRIATSRSRAYIVESIRQPDKTLAISMMPATRHESPVRYQTVTVVTNDGQRITGVRKNEDSFSVQLMTQKEELRAFLKQDVREVIPEQTSLMPAYDEKMLNNNEMQDLLAFLESLETR